MFKKKKEVKSSSSHIEIPGTTRKKSAASGSPFVYEKSFGDALSKRSELQPFFQKSIGPSDLVHVSQSHGSHDEGQFHYVTGLDVSSEAAPVAYLTKLVFSQFGKNSSKFVGIYCCWDCFGKQDLRVRCEFPGQVTAVSLSGNGQVTRAVWDQIFVSCVIRSVLFSDDLERARPALVQHVLISTPSAGKRVVSMMVQMLPLGRVVGASELHQSADFARNFLVDALMKVLEITNLHNYALSLIEPLVAKNFAFHTILVLILQHQRDELRLVKELKKGVDYYSQSQEKPGFLDWYLVQQSQLMIQKSRLDSALYLAIKAVEKNPTEFLNWTNLVEMYISKRDVHNALLTLNSCPVYSLPSARTIQRVKEENSVLDPKLENVDLPEPSSEGFLEDVWEQANRAGPVYLKSKESIFSEDFASPSELASVDPPMLRLAGPKLRGTFKTAYHYLSSLAILVGWDALLKIRAEVFVMEGEFQSIVNQNGVFKTKRLCERWLDSLFFMLYDDLRVVSLWETKARKSGNALTHSTLEWEILGITALRAKHYDLAVSALRTSMKAKFSIISAKMLLEIFDSFYNHYESFKRLDVNWDDMRHVRELVFLGSNNVLFPPKKEFIVSTNKQISAEEQLKSISQQTLENSLYLDLILEVVIKIFSWNFRWYDDFSVDTVIFLKKILEDNDKDLIINRLKAAFASQGNAVRLVERYLGYIETFAGAEG